MSAVLAWQASAPPPEPKPIHATFPPWLRAWWIFSERGFDAWWADVWIVIGWGLAVVALTLVSPLVLIGITCRGLVHAACK